MLPISFLFCFPLCCVGKLSAVLCCRCCRIPCSFEAAVEADSDLQSFDFPWLCGQVRRSLPSVIKGGDANVLRLGKGGTVEQRAANAQFLDSDLAMSVWWPDHPDHEDRKCLALSENLYDSGSELFKAVFRKWDVGHGQFVARAKQQLWFGAGDVCEIYREADSTWREAKILSCEGDRYTVHYRDLHSRNNEELERSQFRARRRALRSSEATDDLEWRATLFVEVSTSRKGAGGRAGRQQATAGSASPSLVGSRAPSTGSSPRTVARGSNAGAAGGERSARSDAGAAGGQHLEMSDGASDADEYEAPGQKRKAAPRCTLSIQACSPPMMLQIRRVTPMTSQIRRPAVEMHKERELVYVSQGGSKPVVQSEMEADTWDGDGTDSRRPSPSQRGRTPMVGRAGLLSHLQFIAEKAYGDTHQPKKSWYTGSSLRLVACAMHTGDDLFPVLTTEQLFKVIHSRPAQAKKYKISIALLACAKDRDGRVCSLPSTMSQPDWDDVEVQKMAMDHALPPEPKGLAGKRASQHEVATKTGLVVGQLKRVFNDREMWPVEWSNKTRNYLAPWWAGRIMNELDQNQVTRLQEEAERLLSDLQSHVVTEATTGACSLTARRRWWDENMTKADINNPREVNSPWRWLPCDTFQSWECAIGTVQAKVLLRALPRCVPLVRM